MNDWNGYRNIESNPQNKCITLTRNNVYLWVKNLWCLLKSNSVHWLKVCSSYLKQPNVKNFGLRVFREERKLFKNNTQYLNNLEWYNLIKGRNETSKSSIARCRQFAIRAVAQDTRSLLLGDCCWSFQSHPSHKQGRGGFSGIWLVRGWSRVSQGCCQVGWME